MKIGWKLAVVYAVAVALGAPWWLPLALAVAVVAALPVIGLWFGNEA